MIALVTAKSCEVPHVAMTVQFAGKTSLGTQQASEFVLPLFSDCTYQFPGDAVLASVTGPAPATMVAMSFADNGFFTDREGQLLDSENLDRFLSHFGEGVDANTLLNLVICSVFTDAGGEITIGPRSRFVFNGEASQGISHYQCIPGFVFG
ncbi:hypothetical protein DL95DRAFT_470810 [Leptodontidium sp. 2 PMI_412]|nr:hypothetical protein DL95DRAFT_470810 [Leptodontidium sp. 2 PMI_412]